MCAGETFVRFPLHVRSPAGNRFCSAKVVLQKERHPWEALHKEVASFGFCNQPE